MSGFSLSRRRFARWLAASPLLLAGTGKSFAAWNNVDTPPVFAKIEPATVRPIAPRAHIFASRDVRLLDGPFAQARHANLSYLRRLDPDRLLHTFRLNAGLPSDAKPLGGWEEPKGELRGHFMGHYLSGCALAFAADGDAELRARGDHVVAVLAE